MNYYIVYDSPVGRMLLTSDGEALTGTWFDGQKYFEDLFKKSHYLKGTEFSEKALPVLKDACSWLDIYFEGRDPGKLPPIRFVSGTEFQRQVWEILKGIPYGQVITYGDIAMQIAEKRGIKRMAAQAVGQAVGHNPVGVIVPCHRVVGNNGNLTGYGGGMDRKVYLLELEGHDMSRFSRPDTGEKL